MISHKKGQGKKVIYDLPRQNMQGKEKYIEREKRCEEKTQFEETDDNCWKVCNKK